jgi:hypothetical protein
VNLLVARPWTIYIWPIHDAFDFDGEYLYSFFMSGKAWGISDFEHYHPEADCGTPEANMRTLLNLIGGSKPKLPATTAKTESLNLEPKQKFIALFDYGDEWQFEVEFLNEGSSEKALYPRIIDSRGEAPRQYDNCDEEED